jgi:hypothetical protein
MFLCAWIDGSRSVAYPTHITSAVIMDITRYVCSHIPVTAWRSQTTSFEVLFAGRMIANLSSSVSCVMRVGICSWTYTYDHIIEEIASAIKSPKVANIRLHVHSRETLITGKLVAAAVTAKDPHILARTGRSVRKGVTKLSRMYFL